VCASCSGISDAIWNVLQAEAAGDGKALLISQDHVAKVRGRE
jgi:hypothetical protein